MSDLASFLQGKLRQRALEGPSGMEMLSQLMMLPIGGSRAGAVRGNDHVTANKLHNRMYELDRLNAPTWDAGVTGGSPLPFQGAWPPVPPLPHPQASAGLAASAGVTRAANPFGMRFSGRHPANVNEPPPPGSVDAWRMARSRDGQ